MEEHTHEHITTHTLENKGHNDNSKQIAGAIIVAGLLIAGAILLKGNMPSSGTNAPVMGANPTVAVKIAENDRALGNKNAKVALVMYEDFQCPFCGKFFKEVEEKLRDTYVNNGKVQFVYRDFAFLGEESVKAAEAARCAGEQNKFWEFHDYLFNHQNGENQGNFSDAHLKSFAKDVGLDQSLFDQCFSAGKYAQAIADSKNEGGALGVQGTPKGFIVKNGKVVATIDGAEPLTLVTQKLDAALK